MALPQKNKKIITVTLPNAMGGVASFNRNILYFFDRNLVFIRVILISVKEDLRVEVKEGFNCDELIKFSYSRFDNFSHVLRRLGLIIGNDSNYILTDNGITIDALSYTKSKSIIHYLNHDFFYVKQAIAYSRNIDFCIAHSQFFNDCLASADYNSFEDKLTFIPYGVKLVEKINKVKNERLKLVFLGRLDYSKGVLSLIEIENNLKKKNIDVDWLIIGDGPLKKQLFNQWKEKDNVLFRKPSTTKEVYNLLQEQDILIFPSLFEGTPVAIFEAVACGCVPIVYNIPGGVREYLNDDFSFKVVSKDLNSISKVIEDLNNDRAQLSEMQNFAFQFSKTHLDQAKLNRKYFEFIYNSTKINTSRQMPKLSFFDQKFIPNILSWSIKRAIEIVKRNFKVLFL